MLFTQPGGKTQVYISHGGVPQADGAVAVTAEHMAGVQLAPAAREHGIGRVETAIKNHEIIRSYRTMSLSDARLLDRRPTAHPQSPRADDAEISGRGAHKTRRVKWTELRLLYEKMTR